MLRGEVLKNIERGWFENPLYVLGNIYSQDILRPPKKLYTPSKPMLHMLSALKNCKNMPPSMIAQPPNTERLLSVICTNLSQSNYTHRLFYFLPIPSTPSTPLAHLAQSQILPLALPLLLSLQHLLLPRHLLRLEPLLLYLMLPAQLLLPDRQARN